MPGPPATGVDAVSKGGHRVRSEVPDGRLLRAGAIHTAALLLRFRIEQRTYRTASGIWHPVSNVGAEFFKEEIRPVGRDDAGDFIPTSFRNLTGNYGVKFETTALQPVIAMAPLPWRNAFRNFRGLMGEVCEILRRLAYCCADRHGGPRED